MVCILPFWRYNAGFISPENLVARMQSAVEKGLYGSCPNGSHCRQTIIGSVKPEVEVEERIPHRTNDL